MSDKTYSETRDEAPFDWHQALRFPEMHDHPRLCDMAASWVTCACGNQCAIIPRAVAGKEDDVRRGADRRHPERAWIRVCGCSAEYAERILFGIEARSAILIAEEPAKRNTPAYAESAQE